MIGADMETLNKQARETIKWYWTGETHRERTTIAGYTRHFFGDQPWGGDRCGCVDNRCIGYHHDGEEGCHCLPNWLDDYVKAIIAARQRSHARSPHTEAPAPRKGRALHFAAVTAAHARHAARQARRRHQRALTVWRRWRSGERRAGCDASSVRPVGHAVVGLAGRPDQQDAQPRRQPALDRPHERVVAGDGQAGQPDRQTGVGLRSGVEADRREPGEEHADAGRHGGSEHRHEPRTEVHDDLLAGE